jgi:hypothetical protein
MAAALTREARPTVAPGVFSRFLIVYSPRGVRDGEMLRPSTRIARG